jgi:tripeptide aminopeptidase
MDATRALGAEPEFVASSTDSNVPLSLGIPAITIGVGGESGGIHTTEEWYENVAGPEGIERTLLIILGCANAA